MIFETMDLSSLSLRVGLYIPSIFFEHIPIANPILNAGVFIFCITHVVMIRRFVYPVNGFTPSFWRAILVQPLGEIGARTSEIMTRQMHFKGEFIYEAVHKPIPGCISFYELCFGYSTNGARPPFHISTIFTNDELNSARISNLFATYTVNVFLYKYYFLYKKMDVKDISWNDLISKRFNHLLLPKSIRGLIIGKSGCGKTTLLLKVR